jgi:trehalose 6-phosphate phosphatase
MDPDPALLAPLRSAPERAAVLVDFDGTLSPIVTDNAAARPLPGAGEVLLALRDRYARVAVVSGRPIAYLAAHLPAEIDLSGLYGLEQRRDGEVAEHPAAAGWRTAVDGLAAAAREALPEGVEVEHKGLSLTLHLRRHPELTDAAGAWAQEAAADAGFALRTAKRSFELHPPVAVDPGTVVDELTAGCEAACYVGDDVGDLDAFDGLDRLAARGGSAVRVAVRTEEVAAELLDRADLVVDGPAGALALLRSLVDDR